MSPRARSIKSNIPLIVSDSPNTHKSAHQSPAARGGEMTQCVIVLAIVLGLLAVALALSPVDGGHHGRRDGGRLIEAWWHDRWHDSRDSPPCDEV